MQSIEINTTQNVHISYEVAHLGDRIFAFIIDFLVILAVFIVTAIFSGIAMSGNNILFFLVSLPFFIFYNLVAEITMNGRTIGKRSMNLKVVKTNGKEPKNMDFFLRWVFRMIDIYFSLGTIAVIFIATSKNGQRLGDLISDTTLIRIKPGSHITFDDILRNQGNAEVEITYPWAKNLTDKEVLVIQEVLRKSKKYKNEAHNQVLDDVITNVRRRLQLDDQEVITSKEQFLKTTIRDYIALTR